MVTWEDESMTVLSDCPKPALVRLAAYAAKACRTVEKPASSWLATSNLDLIDYITRCVDATPDQYIGRKSGVPATGTETHTEPEPTPRSGGRLPDAGTVSVSVADAAKVLADAIAAGSSGATVDESTVRRIVAEEVAKVSRPVRVEVERAGEVTEVPGTCHNLTPTVLRLLDCGRNVWLVGPAGTGKSTIGLKCAEALGFAFSSLSLSPMVQLSTIFGYKDANGRPVHTETCARYRDGGVLLYDEMDNSNPSTVASVNMILGNDLAAFACCGMVQRHKDFRFLATANTYGLGPDRMYVGRQQLDAATLDRFVQVEVPVDEALEDALAHAQGADPSATDRLVRFAVSGPRRRRRACPWSSRPAPASMGRRCSLQGSRWPRSSLCGSARERLSPIGRRSPPTSRSPPDYSRFGPGIPIEGIGTVP
jgi:hypothetical protein